VIKGIPVEEEETLEDKSDDLIAEMKPKVQSLKAKSWRKRLISKVASKIGSYFHKFNAGTVTSDDNGDTVRAGLAGGSSPSSGWISARPAASRRAEMKIDLGPE
jgi:hypothetical protein